jgi:hypothetical protein
MRQTIVSISFLFFITTVLSCKKNIDTPADCSAGSATTRLLVNKQATVKAVGSQFYIVEEGTIDTKLNPCNLTQEFKIHDLQVTVSGDVKATVQEPLKPCCTENFIITKISK